MRWLTFLVLLPGCFEYGLEEIGGPVGRPDAVAPSGTLAELGGSGSPVTSDGYGDPTEEPGLPGRLESHTVQQGFGLPSEEAGPDEADEDWWNDPWAEPPDGFDDAGEPGEGNGGEGEETPNGGLARMTGGGGVDDVAHPFGEAFTVHCAETHHANELNLDLGGGLKFKLDGVEWVICLDDPALESGQPEPSFDTVVGQGWGTMQGEDAEIWFVFTDDGEPGTTDHARFEVHTGSMAYAGEGYLTQGNHQVHDPVGQL